VFLWFIDNLPVIFWGLMTWIFLSVAFVTAYVLTRRAYIRRHPMPWEGRQWENRTIGNLNHPN